MTDETPTRPRGRPPGRSPDARTYRIDVWLSLDEMQLLDERRKDRSASDFLALASGIRTPAPSPDRSTP